MTMRVSLCVLAAFVVGTHPVMAQVKSPARTRAVGKPAPAVAVADVKLGALKSAPATLPASTRNPFRFTEAPVKVAAPRTGPAKIVAAPPAEVLVPTGPPPPPPILLRFIGVIEVRQRAGRVALLSDGKGGLMNGREGDVIEGRYRVLRVGADSLDLAYTDGRGRQTIRLSGQ